MSFVVVLQHAEEATEGFDRISSTYNYGFFDSLLKLSGVFRNALLLYHDSCMLLVYGVDCQHPTGPSLARCFLGDENRPKRSTASIGLNLTGLADFSCNINDSLQVLMG